MMVRVQGVGMARPTAGMARESNQQRVLNVLLSRGDDALTYAQVADAAGLAVGTVTSILREYAEAGVVDTTPGAGRRGATVRIGRGAGLVAGVDFGHHHLAVAVADMSGTVVAERLLKVDVDQEHQKNFARAAELIDELVAESGEPRTALRTVGLGLPAPLSQGRVLGNTIMPGWVGLDIEKFAVAAFGCPVLVDNDANLAALGEYRRGAGQGHDNLVFAKISGGLGAGIIVNGRILSGAAGIAGELGHLTYDEQGPLCRCGSRGCLEAYTSTTAARDLMRAQMPGASLTEMVDAALGGNAAAQRVFEDAGLHLGWGLAVAANLLNPGVIIVGGDMAKAGELLLESTRMAMRRHVFEGAVATPVVASALGDRASVIGAVIAAVDATDLTEDGQSDEPARRGVARV